MNIVSDGIPTAATLLESANKFTLPCNIKNALCYLQHQFFAINYRAMSRFLTTFLTAATLAFCTPSFSFAAEEPGDISFADNTRAFFERYTNAAQDVILEGLKLVGVRYRMGGNSIEAGLDCSSFVQMVFKESIGTYLPRTAREQSQIGEKIDLDELKPGDLVFFNTMRRAFSHVGIYLGDNHFLHAPRAGAEVRVESMKNSYWMSRFNGARRIIGAQ